MSRLLLLALLSIALSTAARAQAPARIPVADQTFKAEGMHEYIYAFAEGDQVDLYVQLLMGRELKVVELVQYPENSIFRSYELDTALTKTINIPQTGIYLLRLQEKGLGKKVCRFTLHRTPARPGLARFDTRVGWDIRQYPTYQVLYRSVTTGKRTDVVSLGGQATVSANKFGLKKPVSNYQFTLPPYTVRWAYRLAVGQAGTQARQQDAAKFSQLLKQGAVKMAGYQPQTALAAFALGMTIDLTTTTTGEDVEYALVDGPNLNKFLKYEPYQAFMQQPGVTVDAQRRYSPLEGTYYFAMKSNNWMDDINVTIDIEAVTEIPIFDTETYLEPIRN
jgi:hypothetical protein